ncbi:MAG: NUDIX hydrolase [Chloroflexota bacterium]|nr:NUDIX hydrolase [Dehalococcoidia bacterium]MDW8253813.1 NUDIX hydrolase [Chloroflexota bacterium]
MLTTGWTRLARTVLHENAFRRFFLDRVRIHSGDEIEYSWAEAAAASFVVPLTDDGEIVLIRQYRYPVDRWVWEVPAGRIEGEPSEETARRELLEEVGGIARTIVPLGTCYSAAAHLHLLCAFFLATGVVLDQTARREATELLEVRLVPAEEAFALVRRGGDIEAQSGLAILMAEPTIRSLVR